MKRFTPKFIDLAIWLVCALVCSFPLAAQSRDQNFPTAVSTNEINGSIKARDIGDSRLTSYYFVFDGGQGDIFINVVTKNFNGDIDVFTKDAMRSLTKIVIYADASVNETGRLIYLRKNERLILRVEGRTPNDDAATFRIKFGGSFIAIADQKNDAPPTLDDRGESKTTVNSVGTRIEVPAKTTTTAKAKETKTADPEKEKAPVEDAKARNVPKSEPKKPVVVIEDNTAEKRVDPPATKPTKTVETPTKTTAKAMPPEKKPDPLASIRLIILLKDGSLIERPMSEVSKFSVDKGILVVVAKDGRLSRFSILDVAKVTIE